MPTRLLLLLMIYHLSPVAQFNITPYCNNLLQCYCLSVAATALKRRRFVCTLNFGRRRPDRDHRHSTAKVSPSLARRWGPSPSPRATARAMPWLHLTRSLPLNPSQAQALGPYSIQPPCTTSRLHLRTHRPPPEVYQRCSREPPPTAHSCLINLPPPPAGCAVSRPMHLRPLSPAHPLPRHPLPLPNRHLLLRPLLRPPPSPPPLPSHLPRWFSFSRGSF